MKELVTQSPGRQKFTWRTLLQQAAVGKGSMTKQTGIQCQGHQRQQLPFRVDLPHTTLVVALYMQAHKTVPGKS